MRLSLYGFHPRFVICDKKPKLSELPKLHKKFTAVAFNKHKELIAARKFIITVGAS